MTTTGVTWADDAPGAARPSSPDGADAAPGDPTVVPGPPPRRRRRLVVTVAAVAVLVGLFGYLVGNITQADTQTAQTTHTLRGVQARTRAVDAQLAVVRAQLADVTGQVAQGASALAADTATLQGVERELSSSQVAVWDQGAAIGSLHTCLGGVEQALNALSVGDQPHALAALHAVAPSCDAAAVTDG